MRLCSAAVRLGVAAAIMSAIGGTAAAQTCDNLWYERNSIYKSFGYCFKTERAIAVFGNAGCMYDVESALPMAPGARARISEIARTEQAMGCR